MQIICFKTLYGRKLNMDLPNKIFSHKFYMLLLVFSFIKSGRFDVDVKEISLQLSAEFKAFRDQELGLPVIEKLYNNFKHSIVNVPNLDHVRKIADKLENKVQTIFSALTNTSVIINELLSKDVNVPSTSMPCKNKLFYPDYKETKNGDAYNYYIFQQMQQNMTFLSTAIKQQYYLSQDNLRKMNVSPFTNCNLHNENLIWKQYIKRNIYLRKNIVLILDHGGSLSKRQILVVKSIAIQILSSLSPSDRVALIGVASNYSYAESDCSTKYNNSNIPFLQEAKSSYIATLIKFVESLIRGNGATHHVLGLQFGTEIAVKNFEKYPDETVMVFYISRGLLSSLTEPKTVLQSIAHHTNNVNITLVINTCAVIDDLKPVMYETHFLRDIAYQNYTKYNISYANRSFKTQGHMFTVNRTDDVGFAINKIFSVFNPKTEFNIDKEVSLPAWDSTDLTVTFTYGWYTPRNNFALLGINIYFANLAEDISYFSSNQQYQYAFLMDRNGLVLVHPSISRPSVASHDISFVDVRLIEKVHDIQLLRNKMLNESEGIHISKNTQNQEVEYAWSKVLNWYVVCMVTDKSYKDFNKPFKASPSPSVSKLMYQTFDGAKGYKLCRHLNQIATLDAASLYLSMSCFQSPFLASQTTQDKLILQGYLAYLNDNTGLLVNPGLKKEIRDEVSALAHILDYLRKRHRSSPLSKYIVRRYASSYNGVLQMFPGSVLTPSLEVTKRPWFLRALIHKHNVVLIPPYLDKGGAGYIITLAYATSETVVAVDLTYGYILKVLLKQMPFCLDANVKCFLIDDQGYIIYHPHLMDVTRAAPVEQQHIVHRESLVANDILNHQHFIRKLLCNNYGDKTIQRFYMLNTSFTDVLINFVPGEHCVSYRIASVSNTNIFVGVVNTTCDAVAAFCPCSIVDRLCLNCMRMEQKECECPCECPLDPHSNSSNSCPDKTKNSSNITIMGNSPCLWYSDIASVDRSFVMDTESQLEFCFPVNCQIEQTHLDCLGLIGCEWCRFDMEGNYLKKQFCSPITSCFNGVFGLGTPYRGDFTASSLPSDTEYSPIGPILGSVIAMFILLILLFICYRSYTNSAVESLYLSSTQDQFGMSDLNVNENYDQGNHRDKLLNEDFPDSVSPYCVANTYRRTNTAADSDHGYSTMTPHDESEHMSLAPIDSLEDDVMSDNTSVHTCVSTKHGLHIMSPTFTNMTSRNYMVVPVTVHRNMETT